MSSISLSLFENQIPKVLKGPVFKFIFFSSGDNLIFDFFNLLNGITSVFSRLIVNP